MDTDSRLWQHVSPYVMVLFVMLGAWLSGTMATWIISGRGAIGPAILESESIPVGLLAAILSVGLGAILAITTTRIRNTAAGMFVLGGVIFGMAWRFATVEEFVMVGSPIALVAETAIWFILIAAASWIVFRFGGPFRDIEPDENGRIPNPIFSIDAAKMFAAGAVVLPVVWILAQSPMKGQVLGAVFGGLGAGMAGRLLAPHVQPLLLFASPILFGAVGQLIGIAMLGGDDPIDAVARGTLPAFLLPMPVDYAAASVLGVAVGLGAVKSFLHHEETDGRRSTTAA